MRSDPRGPGARGAASVSRGRKGPVRLRTCERRDFPEKRVIQGAAWPRTATKNVEGRLHTGHRPDRPRVAFPGSAERGAASEARRCLAGKHRAAVNRSHRQADEAAAAAASRGHWAVLAPLASLTHGTPRPAQFPCLYHQRSLARVRHAQVLAWAPGSPLTLLLEDGPGAGASPAATLGGLRWCWAVLEG